MIPDCRLDRQALEDRQTGVGGSSFFVERYFDAPRSLDLVYRGSHLPPPLFISLSVYFAVKSRMFLNPILGTGENLPTPIDKARKLKNLQVEGVRFLTFFIYFT